MENHFNMVTTQLNVVLFTIAKLT